MPIVYTGDSYLGNSEGQKGLVMGRGRSAAALILQNAAGHRNLRSSPWGCTSGKEAKGKSNKQREWPSAEGWGTPKDGPGTLRGFTVWVGFEADLSLAL